MALFNKLFSSNKRKLIKTSSPQHTTSQFSFNSDQVRVLLYRECDWRGRRLLFDSSALEKINVSANPPKCTNNVQSPQCGIKKPEKPGHIEYCDGVPFKHGRPSPDYNSLGEMVFGSVAMSFRGTSFKVHWLKSPTRLMCSLIFLAPVKPPGSTTSSSTNTNSSSNNNTSSSGSNYGSDLLSGHSDLSSLDTNSLNSFSCASDSVQSINNERLLMASRGTIPLDVPTLSLDNDDMKFFSHSVGDSSGYNSAEPWMTGRYPYSSARSSLASIYSDIDNPRKLSIDSMQDAPICEYGRFNRRIMKNLSTSFENVSTIDENAVASIIENNYYTVTGATNMTGMSDGCVSKLRRNSEVMEPKRKTVSGDGISGPHRVSSRRPRLGVAVCITLSNCVEEDMMCFCAEHMALLESMLYRLRATAENAYISKQQFLQIMLRGWNTTSQWLVDIFTAPRLACPIWLHLSIGSVKNPTVLVNSFMNDLCSLLNTADTKDTNFFVSTLLTAVLTHHLGWVGTVAPLVTENIRENMNSSQPNPLIAKIMLEKENHKLSKISKSYPYNALWAQLGDLYGAIANPIKVCKTIICGTEFDIQIIERFLSILTYFIRCSEIKRNHYTKVVDRENINRLVNQQLNSKSHKNTEEEMSFKNLKTANKSGLTRSSTTVKDMSQMDEEPDSMNSLSSLEALELTGNIETDSEKYHLLLNILKKNVMNDIPKVLAFRDSRMVQQELRIGNKSMDTGIEMNLKDKLFLRNYQKHVLLTTGEQIKLSHYALPLPDLTVTRPDADGVEETIELDDDNFISLSNLITANSLGGDSAIKLFWHAEPNKEALNLEQIEYLERMAAKHQISTDDLKLAGKSNASDSSSGVVFVLGENEQLVGLKTSPSMQSLQSLKEIDMESIGAIRKSPCKHKYKKHSGVKFNFEQYPQIATNYMKSKNLEFSEHEILEKGLKIERENMGGASTSKSPNKVGTTEIEDSDEEEDCDCCRNGSRASYLQTPSNASELEYSSDSPLENIYPTFSSKPKPNLDVYINPYQLETLDEEAELKSEAPAISESKMKVIEIPMLDTFKLTTPTSEDSTKPGFTPSLFTATSDHYIADIVLQGTTSLPNQFEHSLKQDLTISSHCAVLEQSQAENVAIVANVNSWDVRLISSHSSVLPSNPGASGIVGMSQLVASLLESVQAMWTAGMTAFQCLSFIESKLREIYLQSETLAAFLMETEFCTLNTLTTVLDLSVNDIPLLLNIASIHSPKVTKKYGVSFR